MVSCENVLLGALSTRSLVIVFVIASFVNGDGERLFPYSLTLTKAIRLKWFVRLCSKVRRVAALYCNK